MGDGFVRDYNAGHYLSVTIGGKAQSLLLLLLLVDTFQIVRNLFQNR
jgi:hypothetical protein